MQALHDYVFVWAPPKKVEEAPTGLYVPEAKEEDKAFDAGEVYTVGALVTAFAPGDLVMYSVKAANKIETEDGTIFLMKAEAVVAKLKQ